MRPDLMPDAVTYTRFQLSALELNLLLAAVGLFLAYHALRRFVAYVEADNIDIRVRERQAGRAAGYAGLPKQVNDNWSRPQAWHHGYAEGKAAREAGKPLEYLAERLPLGDPPEEKSHGG